MKTIEEINKKLDEIDEWIMSKYPEEMHSELHYIIAEKVKLEIERDHLLLKK